MKRLLCGANALIGEVGGVFYFSRPKQAARSGRMHRIGGQAMIRIHQAHQPDAALPHSNSALNYASSVDPDRLATVLVVSDFPDRI